MRRLAPALTAWGAVVVAGCAHTSATNTVEVPPRSLNGRVFIMEAVGAQRTAIEDGRTIQKVQGFPPPAGEFITDYILAVVRQWHPDAELVATPFLGDAVRSAVDRGAGYLLVPEVRDWYDAETQYTGVRDRIEIELRLLQLRPRATVASVIFKKRSGVLAIHDHSPTRLLDHTFTAAIRQLLVGVRQ